MTTIIARRALLALLVASTTASCAYDSTYPRSPIPMSANETDPYPLLPYYPTAETLPYGAKDGGRAYQRAQPG